MNEQQQAQFDAKKTKLLSMVPRGYKSDGSGLVQSFTIEEFQLDANDNLISVAGKATVKTEDGGTSDPFNVLWNQAGQAYHVQQSVKVFLDLVNKVAAE